MRKLNYKGRCTKRTLKKCEGVCRTFDDVQTAFTRDLELDEDIVSFRCNVWLEGLEGDQYMSDVVAVKKDGSLMVRECTWRKMLNRISFARLLDKSRNYWLAKGVTDWGIVIERREDSLKEKENSYEGE